jgi:hypothetical protein
LVVDWNAETNPAEPTFKWTIHTPDSLFYPGTHVGRLELNIRGPRSNIPSVLDSRLRIYWESGIFSTLPNSTTGLLSSAGPLEETPAARVLTSALQSIAHFLSMGPFAKPVPEGLFGWHDMGWELGGYFAPGREDACMRACAFFANAFTRDVDWLEDLGFQGLSEDCREASRMAIRELAEFFQIGSALDELAATGNSGSWSDSYAKANSQLAWVLQDRVWAGRIAELAKLQLLASTSKRQSVSKVRQHAWICLGTYPPC